MKIMPRINKSEKIIERIKTDRGEITINLNLTITLDSGEIVIKTESVQKNEEEIKHELAQTKDPLIIPEEMFDVDIPLVANFGQKK